MSTRRITLYVISVPANEIPGEGSTPLRWTGTPSHAYPSINLRSDATVSQTANIRSFFLSSLNSTPPDDENRSKPMSTTRVSTSHEDVSKDDCLIGEGDFRRVKSERRPRNFFRRNYKLPPKEEEKLERQKSLRLRQSIRAKWGLPEPSRKNPLLSE